MRTRIVLALIWLFYSNPSWSQDTRLTHLNYSGHTYDLYQDAICKNGYLALYTLNPTGPGPMKMILTKLDINHNLLWNRSIKFNGSANRDTNVIVHIYTDPLSNIYLTSVDIFNYVHIMKLDSSGQYQWSKKLSCGSMQGLRSLYPIQNGSYIHYIINDGTAWYSNTFIRLDANGNIIWQQNYKLDEHDFYTNQVLIRSNDDIIGVGNGYPKMTNYSISNTGQVKWITQYDTLSPYARDYLDEVFEFNSNRYLYVGRKSNQNGTDFPFFFSITDSSGIIVNQTILYDVQYGYAHLVKAQLSDHNTVLLLFSDYDLDSMSSFNLFYEVDINGNILNAKQRPIPQSEHFMLRLNKTENLYSFISAYGFYDDFEFYKGDDYLNTCIPFQYFTPNNSITPASSMNITSNIQVSGPSLSLQPSICSSSPFAGTTSATICESLLGDPFPEFEFQVFPNPTYDYINIVSGEEIKSIELFNIQGQKLFLPCELSNSGYFVDLRLCSSGIYLVKVEVNTLVKYLKIIRQ